MASLKPPSVNEVDYFKRVEVRRLRGARAARVELAGAASAQARARLRASQCLGCERCTCQLVSLLGCEG